MIPNEVFRIQDGGLYEDYPDAVEGSIGTAGWELLQLIKTDRGNLKESSKLRENSLAIQKAMKTLSQAFEEKLITKYKLSK